MFALDPVVLAMHARNVAAGRGRAILFDLGATTFLDHMPGMRWLVENYGEHGIRFEHIYAWEVRTTLGTTFFEGMPASIVGAVHFYNFPVAVEGAMWDWQHPLKLLKQVARPEDFVVFKLDIDTSFIEVPLAKIIAQDATVASLIDEFYFEHHVDIIEMRSSWQKSIDGTLHDSIRLFQAIRQQGIRAHWWP